MDNQSKMPPQTALFQVYLRLRPPLPTQIPKLNPSEPWLIVESPVVPNEQPTEHSVPIHSTHVTLQPPNDSRKRAVERFGFTKVFQEDASQLNVFEETGTAESVRNVLSDGRDGLIATLGVTGSGKSHTILGSKSQRGLTQMTLDVLFRSINSHIQKPENALLSTNTELLSSLQACDSSEAHIISANSFLDSTYGDSERCRLSRAQTPMVGSSSRAQTPMMVWHPTHELPGSFPTSPSNGNQCSRKSCPTLDPRESDMSFHSLTPSLRLLPTVQEHLPLKRTPYSATQLLYWNRLASSLKKPAKERYVQDSNVLHTAPRRQAPPPRPSALPQQPDVSAYTVDVDQNSDYVVLVSMYEVYNDRIFDLLSSVVSPNGPQISTRQGAALQKGLLRRPLLFKNTEMSQDRKVVAGLRKVVCGSYDEAMMVLETGLTERRVAGTGSNNVSSRSHGFFCIEIKRRPCETRYRLQGGDTWTGGTLSIVDLAGSERARNAKTTGSTLAEAGKINESLMYLGQCLQVQSDCQQDGSKPIVPFRQCKLTELLFSNSFPSSNQALTYRNAQKAIMIVTADPQGDFNATSQILRYSALAREVTVPRIPSVTSTILGPNHHSRMMHSGRTTTHDAQYSQEELEQAANEIARLSEECNNLSMKLTEEEIKRTETELRLNATEERMESIEQEIREECWTEMEERIEEEKLRWREAWEEERSRGEAYVDGKIDIVEKSGGDGVFTIHEDSDALRERMEEVERDSEMLREKISKLERELQGRSPTKTRVASQQRAMRLEKAKKKNVLTEDAANTNISTNPFLASLRARDVDAAQKSILETKNDWGTEEAKPAKPSPRKASLRSSSMVKMEEEENEPALLQVSVKGTPVLKKQRKLTPRMRDFGDYDV